MSAREEGREACRKGKRRSACPYRGTKKEVMNRVDWLTGYAEQAKAEAFAAVVKSQLEEDRRSDEVEAEH